MLQLRLSTAKHKYFLKCRCLARPSLEEPGRQVNEGWEAVSDQGVEGTGRLASVLCLKAAVRTSLVVQWLRPHSPCRGRGFDPWLGKLKSHMLHGTAKKIENK